MPTVPAGCRRCVQSQSVERKLAVLGTWLMGGRSGEAAFMHVGGLRWDKFQQCIVAEVPQTKVSKLKLAAWVAGADRHSCIFLALAVRALPQPIPLAT